MGSNTKIKRIAEWSVTINSVYITPMLKKQSGPVSHKKCIKLISPSSTDITIWYPFHISCT